MLGRLCQLFLVSAVIRNSGCAMNWPMETNKSGSGSKEERLVNWRINSVDSDNVTESDIETRLRMERLARCVERVNRASVERKLGVFYLRNFAPQEILVTEYLKRISSHVDVLLRDNWTDDDSDDDSTIHNFVLFLHGPNDHDKIDRVLGGKTVDRKGKFVVCISSILWTEKLLVALSNSLWKSKVANAVMIVSDARGPVRIYSYTPVEPEKCLPSKVFVLSDDCDDSDLSAGNLFARKMRNMNLCKVVASTLSIGGSTTVYVVNGTRKVGGVEGIVFNVIAERMNYTGVITPIPASLWGDELPDGTWNGIHGNIMTGVADVGFCLMFPAASRLHFEEYSSAIRSDRYVWILPKPMPTNWNKVLLPFELSVWLASVAALTTAQGVMCLIARVGGERRTAALNIWAITFGQSTMKPRDRRLTRFFLLCWTVFSFVLTNAYQSGLVGFLTSTRLAERLDTVEELLQSGIPFGGARTPAEVYNHPDDPDDYRVYENYRMIPLSKYLSVIYKVIFGKINFASLTVETTLNAHRFTGSWYKLKEAAVYYPRPFVFPKGSPYIAEFNIQITRLVEGGLVNHWIHSNTTGTLSAPGPSHIPLSVVHVASVFILWLIGLSISSLIFVGEILVGDGGKRREGRRTRRLDSAEGPSDESSAFHLVCARRCVRFGRQNKALGGAVAAREVSADDAEFEEPRSQRESEIPERQRERRAKHVRSMRDEPDPELRHFSRERHVRRPHFAPTAKSTNPDVPRLSINPRPSYTRAPHASMAGIWYNQTK